MSDPLAETVRLFGAHGSVGTRTDVGGDWGLWLDNCPGAVLHLISSGTVWLDVPEQSPRWLRPGDAVLLPRGLAHGLSSGEGVRMGSCDLAAASQARGRGGVVRLGSGPVSARFITVHYDLDPAVSRTPVSMPGDVLHVEAARSRKLDATIGLLCDELSNPEIGATAAVNSLVDLLLVQFVRAIGTGGPGPAASPWLTTVSDPVVRDALALLHRRPAYPWTTADLASAVRVSRATLSRRFPAALGVSPGVYLTSLRMDAAAVRLRDTDDPIEVVAETVGYGSAHAFRRAFHRARGQSPLRYRTASRMASKEPPGTAPGVGLSWSSP
ncbi:AraC family transcriptional regulator [Actinoplanes sp. N902-109]|uniref:AraC family transcriptional regulator n=1 Tax=Actinoplanes sp. (strain N902-109) TaxID=649831 RepID=UPI0003295034|nr:AraC family transcriptional regulator [Actinoplanes sp. N902-109]AGL16041.1 AraC family transcriptional regulator [Actinoplanes sp. N902-109]